MDTSNQNVINLSNHQYIVKFYKQPPSHLRKSNFFSFKLVMHDLDNQPIIVENAQFVDFIDTTEEDKTYSNGLIYKFDMIFKNTNNTEDRVENRLFVRLVDSQTKELVPFEGVTKNPDMKRVLVTHELICSRCCQNKSCGNKMCTPSNPVVTDKYYMQVYAKCNQNCVKIAGNPRDSRRFRIAIYCPTMFGSIDANCVALSDPMFVHNNSKYRSEVRPTVTKPPRLLRVDHEENNSRPRIIEVFPSEGWMGGGKDICIIGEYFVNGMQTIFGSQQVPCKIISSSALSVTVPRRSVAGEVPITLYANGEHYCTDSPGIYKYLTMDKPSMDDAFHKLADLLNVTSKETVLQKAVEFIENAQVRSGGLLSNSQTAFNFPPPNTPAFVSPPPPEFNTTAVPTPGESASNSTVIFDNYIHPQSSGIRENSPMMHVARESPNYGIIQQQGRSVVLAKNESHHRQMSTGENDETLYVLSGELSNTMQQQQENPRAQFRSTQYKVPPPLQLAPNALNHSYRDIRSNMSLTSDYLECHSQTQQQQQPPSAPAAQCVPCAVIITPDTTDNGSQHTTTSRSVEPPVDSPMLPQISLSPSAFARMVNSLENQELQNNMTIHQSTPHDNLSMIYLQSPGLIQTNGISSSQMASYLPASSYNIMSPVLQQRLPFEQYNAGPLPSPGMALTFPPPTPTALLAPINMATLSCRFAE